MTSETKLLPCWAVVELMGHLTVAGQVSETLVAGAPLLRIDSPQVGAEPARTQLIGPSSIYRLTPCTEEVARKVILNAAYHGERPTWAYGLDNVALPAPEEEEVEVIDEPTDVLDL